MPAGYLDEIAPGVEIRGPLTSDGSNVIGAGDFYDFYLLRAYHDSMRDALWRSQKGERVRTEEILGDVIERLNVWGCIDEQED